MFPRLAILFLVLSVCFPLSAGPLAREKSRYLRDHADNLVAWSTWGASAFEKARVEGKPIFVSIGYSACHWCHVMERESFMDPEVAALLNKHFVPVLVDREEHPDVDATYIAILDAIHGSAGWPANLVLSPDLKPLTGTTYVRPEGLKRLLRSVAERWSTNREGLLASRDQLLTLATAVSTRPSSPAEVSAETATRQVELLKEVYDAEYGGFGKTPKFPQAPAIGFLLRYSVQRNEKNGREMALRTLSAIAASGIHDQVGGGFHRYAVDRQWRDPHFEKMLYDQALLAISFTEAWQLTNEHRFSNVTRTTLEFVLREMRHPEGGFYAALDSDSAPRPGAEHYEGAYYLWTASELRAAGGGGALAKLGLAPVTANSDSPGKPEGKVVLAVKSIDAELKKKLFAAREKRPRPSIDDKVITGWNGLMISALARAGAAFKEPRYIEAATSAARFVESRLWNARDQKLSRHYTRGESDVEAFAEDFAFVTGGLLDLYEASFDVHWLDLALTLQQRQDALFWDEPAQRYGGGGGLSGVLAAVGLENDVTLPSTSSTSAINLIRLGEMTDDDRWRRRARGLLQTFAPRLTSATDLPHMGSALLLALGTPKQIVIAGERNSEDTKRLVSLIHRRFLPNRILLLVDDASRESLSKRLPLLRMMKPIGRKATAYVCENYVCKLPTSDLARLTQLLERN